MSGLLYRRELGEHNRVRQEQSEAAAVAFYADNTRGREENRFVSQSNTKEAAAAAAAATLWGFCVLASPRVIEPF